jgi:hypothetical protein
MGNILTTISRSSSSAVTFISVDADPRSPTTAFRRTPLRFLRRTAPDLADPRSPMCNRTPLRCAVAHDPREPTAGLVRTPVPRALDADFDPREPTDGLVRTPVPKHRSARRRLVLGDDDDAAVRSVPSTPFNDCCSEVDQDSFVDVDLDDDDDDAVDDDDVAAAAELESESDAPTSSLLFRSPAIKSRSISMRFSQMQSKFAARTPSSLRKVMARQVQPMNDSPHSIRLVDSCPSSPVAA